MGSCRSSPKGTTDEDDTVHINKHGGAGDAGGEFSHGEPTTMAADLLLGSIAHEEHAAEGQSVEWMNYMCRVMWPYMRKAIIKKAGDKFNDAMSTELGKHPEIKLSELKLDFDPGAKCPVINHLLVYQRTQQERNGLQIDTDFYWQPDSEFKMAMTIKGKAGVIPIQADRVGLSGMEVSGTMSCLMAPLIEVEPCFGTGQAFFLDTPKMDLKMMGMKALGPVGQVLTKVLEGVVRNMLQDGYILPHRFLHKVRKDLALDVLVNMKSPPPLGVLMVTVLEGRGLKASDTSLMGKKSSDPFVEIKIGHGKARSSTVEDTVHPVWKDKPICMLIYNVAQLVRVTVYDDDVMGTDILGMLVGYNVYLFCQEAKGKPDGMWFKLVDPQNPRGESVGELRLRVDYFDVADLAKETQPIPKAISSPQAPPYVLTVKLLGLEGEDRGDLRGTRAVVEQFHPDSDDVHNDDKEARHASRLMASLASAVKNVQSKVKHATGLGFGHWEDGVPKIRKSGKAVLWGSTVSIMDHDHKGIPPMAIRAMEKLHMREGWKIEKIANMFGLSPEVVQAAVDMRGNFEVVWHEALHFLQPPDDPFQGRVKVSVTAPASNQVRGADDRGFIGELEIDLKEIEKSPKRWSQRVRTVLTRPKSESRSSTVDKGGEVSAEPHESLQPERATSHRASLAVVRTDRKDMESSGILIELMIEVRQLTKTDCQLDEGQTLRCKEHIIEATTSAGVHVLPE